MSYDPKSKEQIVGVDMNVISKFGFCKFDLLGVSVLDKLKMTQDLVNGTHKKRTLVLDESNENNES
jgi:DNA polymerase III alpha subunit